jgi:hypothetical protein
MKKGIFLLLCLACLSCKDDRAETVGNEEAVPTFDKEKWNAADDSGYLFRERMLPGLLASDTLKKLKKDAIIDLLGEPKRTDNKYLFYTVSEKRVFALPMSVKSLVIKLRDDGSVEWVKTHG